MDQLPTHDSFVRRMLSDRKICEGYLRRFLPQEISGQLDFSKLEQLPDTYLSDDLKKSLADSVFLCPTKKGSLSIKACFLIEHKSHKDNHTLLQIGSYIFSAYRKQFKNKEPLSILIPILLYHGKERWEYQTLDSLFPGIDNNWKRFLPIFEFIFNDVGKMPDHEIKKPDNKALVAFLLTLKHIWDAEWLSANLSWLINLTPRDQTGLQKVIAFYIFSRNKFDENVLNSLPEPIKTDVMNTFDVYYEKGIEKGREEGREEGIEKGIEKGLEKGLQKGKEAGLQEGLEKGKELIVRNLINSKKFTVSEISNFTGVPESFVKKVQSSLRNKK